MEQNALNELIPLLLLVLYALAIPRGIICLVNISKDPDEADKHKKRLKNMIIFVALATCIMEIVNLLTNYFTF